MLAQWNPAAPLWGAPYWGHVASRDLVHWKRLPAAVMPDTDYDADGAFSGSATVLPDGTPVILYTGALPCPTRPCLIVASLRNWLTEADAFTAWSEVGNSNCLLVF